MNKNAKNVGTVHTHTHTHTHTGNLVNNKNRIWERDICKNASNCCVKNLNYKLINENMKTTDPSCMVKDVFFLHAFERKMLHHRGSTNISKLNKINCRGRRT